MASTRFRFTFSLLCSGSLLLVFSSVLLAQAGKAQAKGNNLIRPLADLERDLKGKLERIKVHGKSLEGNLEGDSADRDVFVYLPAKDGKIQPTVVAKWVANAPLAMIDQYATSLTTLRIGIDVGDKDGLAASNRELNRVLNGYGIQTTFEVYDGDHTNHIIDRMEKVVLPFFAKNLVSTQ